MERVFFQLHDPGNEGRIAVIGCFLAVLMKDDDFGLIAQALRLASQYGHPKAESIKQVYYQLFNGRKIKESIQPKYLFPKCPRHQRSSSLRAAHPAINGRRVLN